MMEFLQYILVLLLVFCSFFNGSFAQPPTCAQAGCPTGGVWGEWKTIGSGQCDMECGGCGTLVQTRECISDPICPCTGSSNRTTGCNFNACKYPTQKVCCNPYVPMVVNKVQICGPIPKTIDSSACCPQSTLYSEWSGYSSNGNKGWVRTRRCLTASIGCPCAAKDITETVDVCPCPAAAGLADSDCEGTSLPGNKGYVQTMAIDNEACTATVMFYAANQATQTPPFYFCKPMASGYQGAMNFQGAYITVKESVSKKCVAHTAFDCEGGKNTDKYPSAPRQDVTFTCNLQTKKWILDFTGNDIDSYYQGNWTLN
ncbi:hypothetical protein L3Y34_003733 [Caenorhabditis briggsae]|uniref:Uncharacterized protein n=2 Tax=Caenorhabditis briggsae TaxID=6238 RepID=A0AAE9AC32_CAEBR|nr:hypothetical protein L3Y34_003733 [Caenorhabditis briggsae]